MLLNFEVNIHSKLLQFTKTVQDVKRISAKTGDRFGQDQVNFSLSAICQHLLKLIALQYISSGALVNINACKFPVYVVSNIGIIVGFLCCQTYFAVRRALCSHDNMQQRGICFLLLYMRFHTDSSQRYRLIKTYSLCMQL